MSIKNCNRNNLFGFKENILLAKVFNIKTTKEMTELLVAKDLTKENCPN